MTAQLKQLQNYEIPGSEKYMIPFLYLLVHQLHAGHSAEHWAIVRRWLNVLCM